MEWPELEKEFQRSLAGWTAKLDQRLSDVRGEYEVLDEAGRKQFKDWLDRIVTIDRPEGLPVHASATVQFLIPRGEGDVEGVVVAAASLKRAIAKWDKNQEYLPGMQDV